MSYDHVSRVSLPIPSFCRVSLKLDVVVYSGTDFPCVRLRSLGRRKVSDIIWVQTRDERPWSIHGLSADLRTWCSLQSMSCRPISSMLPWVIRDSGGQDLPRHVLNGLLRRLSDPADLMTVMTVMIS